MTFCPYPNADRARRQLDRHVHRQPARTVVPGFEQIARNLSAAFPPNWERCVENLRAAGRVLQAGRVGIPPTPGSGT